MFNFFWETAKLFPQKLYNFTFPPNMHDYSYFISYMSEWLSSKRLEITNAGEDVQEGEYLYTFVGIYNGNLPRYSAVSVETSIEAL